MTDTNFDGIIDPAASWADIPQLSTEALALGGTGGPMNAQAVALAKRLKYLNENKTDKSDSIGLRAYFERVCAEIGLTLAAGSFEEGATITSSSQALLYLAGKEIFTWGGTLNKTVAADSTPETSGGIGDGAWSNKTSNVLLNELSKQGGIRFSSACASISDLISLSNPQHNQRVDVLGFYAGSLRGGGTFRFQSSVAKSSHNGITVISPTVPFNGTQAGLASFLARTGDSDPAGSGCWVRTIRNGTVETAMSGAVIDGVTDDTVACQAAHNTGLNVEYSSGNYIFTGQGVTPQPGPYIFSAGSGIFNRNVIRTASITNNDVNGSIFSYISDTSTGQKDAPRIRGFYLKADYPIKLNNHLDYVGDGESGVNPYLMRPEVRDNYITARITGTGIGCILAKCFDGKIANNEFYNFAINLVLLGSDINDVHRNRFMGATVYHIYDRSAQSFGSQNEIHNNDILNSADGATYIKTSSHHVRIYNNYLEKPSGSIVGFIDNSANAGIVWNASNVESTPKSVIITDNRLDGRAYCTTFVYRVDNTTPPTLTRIHESGTTGAASGTAEVLSIVGSPNGLLRYRRGAGNVNNCEYDFIGSGFKRFNGFKTKSFDDQLQLNAQNLVNCIGTDIASNGAEAYIRTNGESIVLLPGMTVNFYAGLEPGQDGIANPYFVSGVTYTVTVIARTTSGSGDTLRVGKLSAGSGGILTDMALTTQFRKFTFTMTGAASTDRTGVYLARSTQNGNIEVKSIAFTS